MIQLDIKTLEETFRRIENFFNITKLNKGTIDDIFYTLISIADKTNTEKVNYIKLTDKQQMVITYDEGYHRKICIVLIDRNHDSVKISNPISILYTKTMITLEDKLNIIQSQLEEILKKDNPYDINIVATQLMPSFNMAIIRISYNPCDEYFQEEYLTSRWYKDQLYTPLINREFDNIEVSIVNLQDSQEGFPLPQQVITIA